ncbi:MAG: tetratricopeptide repeat protein [Desulfobulbaceae bacterium]|nr:tetratricopeptide repeat protein [Desulfobulbaceae bacterium]HIJ79812.1 tetratricopeptide repeat protein [Deltaproteobacteria bacterium]
MVTPEQSSASYVKKETLLIVGLCCLVAGFLAGIVFSVYKAPAGGGTQVATTGQAQQSPDISAEQSTQILQLEREVLTNPNNGQAWTSLGHLYFDTNEPEKAIKAYTKSLAILPNNPDVLTDLGVMYRRVGNAKQAIESFDQAIKANPKHETARFNKGIVLLYDVKDQPGAVAAWQSLVQINPMATAPNGKLVKEIITEMTSQKQ